MVLWFNDSMIILLLPMVISLCLSACSRLPAIYQEQQARFSLRMSFQVISSTLFVPTVSFSSPQTSTRLFTLCDQQVLSNVAKSGPIAFFPDLQYCPIPFPLIDDLYQDLGFILPTVPHAEQNFYFLRNSSLLRFSFVPTWNKDTK